MQLALRRQCHPAVLLAVVEQAPEQARTCPPDDYVALAQAYPDQCGTMASVIHMAFKERVNSWWSRSHTEQGGGVPGFVSPWAKAREMRAFFTKWVESPLTQQGVGLNNLQRSLTLVPAARQRPLMSRSSRCGTEGELVFSSDEEDDDVVGWSTRQAADSGSGAATALDGAPSGHSPGSSLRISPRHHVVPMSAVGPTKRSRSRRPNRKGKRNSTPRPWSDQFETAVILPALSITKDFLRSEIRQVLRDVAHAAKVSVSAVGTIHTPRSAASAAEGAFLPSLVGAMTMGLRAVYGPVAAALRVPSQHVQVKDVRSLYGYAVACSRTVWSLFVADADVLPCRSTQSNSRRFAEPVTRRKNVCRRLMTF